MLSVYTFKVLKWNGIEIKATVLIKNLPTECYMICKLV